jgi:hypothetical protein
MVIVLTAALSAVHGSMKNARLMSRPRLIRFNCNYQRWNRKRRNGAIRPEVVTFMDLADERDETRERMLNEMKQENETSKKCPEAPVPKNNRKNEERRGNRREGCAYETKDMTSSLPGWQERTLPYNPRRPKVAGQQGSARSFQMELILKNVSLERVPVCPVPVSEYLSDYLLLCQSA